MDKPAPPEPSPIELGSARPITISDWAAVRADLREATAAMRDTIVVARLRLHAAHRDLLAANECIRIARRPQGPGKP